MKNKGFTLVELAIVLVIIGLLVGGVLQGQELIKQAQIRNVLSSINQYDTAVNTFRAKYNNALAGDFAQATEFGVVPANLALTAAADDDGDGDGLLEDEDSAGTAAYEGEMVNFWGHLSDAGFLKGSFSADTDACGVAATDCDSDAGSQFPAAPVGNGIIALTDATGNLNWVIGVPATAITSIASIIGDQLTPEQAWSLDSKLDDGFGITGGVLAISAYSAAAAFTTQAGAASNTCIDTDLTPDDYEVTDTDRECTIRIRASS
jgi:prepilin-type N-terminal cleavage/methylation domain-containing protein